MHINKTVALVVASAVFHLFESSYFVSLALMKQRYSFVTSLFLETVVSLDTIRSYNLQSYFMNDLQKRIDNVTKCDIMNQYFQGWEDLFQNIFVNLLQFIVTMITIYQIQFNYNQSHKQFVILALWYFVTIQLQAVIEEDPLFFGK